MFILKAVKVRIYSLTNLGVKKLKKCIKNYIAKSANFYVTRDRVLNNSFSGKVEGCDLNINFYVLSCT